MRYAIISDVHANLEALEAVKKDMAKNNIDRIIFLGDAVGYGPNPNETLEDIKRISSLFLAGNHDRAAVDPEEISDFTPLAKSSILWTKQILGEKNKEFLSGLKAAQIDQGKGITFVHSSPKEPDRWHYLFQPGDIQDNFSFLSTRLCFLGHSHQPVIIKKDPQGRITLIDKIKIELDLEKDYYMINVGSVGQPRDQNHLAAYGIYDSEKKIFLFRRVEYPLKITQEKIIRAGLPLELAQRLSLGI